MYAYLKGTIEEIGEDDLVIEVNQIGYRVMVSARTANQIDGIGSFVKLYTYTLVREDAFMLYGFLSRDELMFFKKLITVNGIGPKGGLAILSVLDVNELRFAILSGDAKAISKAPGIGVKTAERVILDLRDKISLEDTLQADAARISAAAAEDMGDQKREAVEALTALGYSATDALKAVKQVELTPDITTEIILKQALKYLF